jgi:hypothetical protein
MKAYEKRSKRGLFVTNSGRCGKYEAAKGVHCSANFAVETLLNNAAGVRVLAGALRGEFSDT